jgi:hypothetical protein
MIITTTTMTYHNKIDERHSVERDVPEIHQPQQIADDHTDGQQHHDGRVEVTAHQNEGHKQDGAQAGRHVLHRVLHDGQVLLVKHVEHTGTKAKCKSSCN